MKSPISILEALPCVTCSAGTPFTVCLQLGWNTRELLVQDLVGRVKWQSFGSWHTLPFICWLALLAWGNRQDWNYPPLPGSSYSCSDSQPWCVLSYMTRVENSAGSKPSRSGAIRTGSFYTSSWAPACPCSPQLSICLFFPSACSGIQSLESVTKATGLPRYLNSVSQLLKVKSLWQILWYIVYTS